MLRLSFPALCFFAFIFALELHFAMSLRLSCIYSSMRLCLPYVYFPISPDYTSASPDYSSASDMEFDPSKDPSSDHIPPLPATSPFFSLTDDSSDSDIPNTPPSPIHAMVLAPGLPHGRPYRYHLNGTVHMMTARKRVGPLPTHRLAARHSVDYSSSGHFSSMILRRFHHPSLTLRLLRIFCRCFNLIPASIRSYFCSIITHPSINGPSHDSSSASPSRKRIDPLAASVPLSSPALGALSYVRADLLPSPKRIRSPESATNLEGCLEDSFEPYVPRETGLGVDFMDESFWRCLCYRGTDLEMDLMSGVINEAIDREEIETGVSPWMEIGRVFRLLRVSRRESGTQDHSDKTQSADMLEEDSRAEQDNRTYET
ncbi:hypothetical protein Tco_0815711 [Tanacetum coccineum]